MSATECPSVAQLRDLSLGRLTAEASDDLLSHVNSCETCRSELETVDEGEDSLIASLRTPGHLDQFQAEPDCDRAMAKALGALADAVERNSNPVSHNAENAERRGWDPSLPQQIGEYEIVRPLGRGGMGNVFLARHTKLGREVALKVLANHRLGDERVRDRFETEMRAVGRLSHPNIVTAHDAREVDGTAVLVTEFIDGFDLGQLLKRTGALSIADACEIMRQTAVALEYTGSQGFVHRDVKPSNIMLGRSGEVKLLDLGLARLQFGDADRPDMTGTGQAMGTADFIAPEQVSDSRSVDIRADIYSLGCTLFNLLAGVPPFAEKHSTVFAKMTAHVSTPAPSLSSFRPDAPIELVQLVDSMLAKEPIARPQTPREVAERLSAFTSGHDFPQLVEKAEQSRELTAKDAEPEAGKRVGPRQFSASHARSAARREASAFGSRLPQSQPFFRRSVPMSMLIATGFASLLLGFAFGVIVKITYPDGTMVSHHVPAGGKVDVAGDKGVKSDTGESNVGPTGADSSKPASAQKLLQGTWQFLEVLDGGQPREDVDGWHMICVGNRYSFPDESGTYTESYLGDGVYALDLNGVESRSTTKAILRFIDTDRVQICLNTIEGERPTKFTSEVDSANDLLMTLGRVKEDIDMRQLVSAPLWFGVLKEESWYDQYGITSAELDGGTYRDRVDPKSGQFKGDEPFSSQTAIWCRVADSVSLPSTTKHNFGNNTPWFTAVERDTLAIIPWNAIHGQMGAMSTGGSNGVELSFGQELAKRMQRLSTSHMNRHLAIVLDGRIIAAPKIVAPVSDRAQISGRFSIEEIQYLHQALNGGLVSP